MNQRSAPPPKDHRLDPFWRVRCPYRFGGRDTAVNSAGSLAAAIVLIAGVMDGDTTRIGISERGGRNVARSVLVEVIDYTLVLSAPSIPLRRFHMIRAQSLLFLLVLYSDHGFFLGEK